MDKKGVLKALIASLEAEVQKAIAASKDAASYATDEEARAESQWDTQGIEASYLAAGQAEQARQSARALEALQGQRDGGRDAVLASDAFDPVGVGRFRCRLAGGR